MVVPLTKCYNSFNLVNSLNFFLILTKFASKCIICQTLFFFQIYIFFSHAFPFNNISTMSKYERRFTAPTQALNSPASVITEYSGPEVIKLFSCSTQLSMKISLLINMKMPTIGFTFTYLLAEKFSCSARFNKKELAIDSKLRFII